MKISVSHLMNLISTLPNPEKYPYNEFHTILRPPMNLNVFTGIVPEKNGIIEIIFKKHFNNHGHYEWYIEY